jgi:pimeloyl-ACP methyl ester carboxylesterase
MQVLVVPGAETDVTLSVTIDDPPASGSGDAPRATRTALIAHGAGSSGEFVRQAFGPPLLTAGWRLVSYDLRGHAGSSAVTEPERLGLSDHVADLGVLARRFGASLLGGVSMGAHAAVLAAPKLAHGVEPAGLLLALPAWTGEPDVVAAANAVQAAEIAAIGVPPVLRRICSDHPGWVADELASTWPRHVPEAFVAVLRGLARSAAPAPRDLGALTEPVGLVALADDPMHPAGVAQQWAEIIPSSRLVTLPFQAPAADRSVLGRACLQAWQDALASDEPPAGRSTR